MSVEGSTIEPTNELANDATVGNTGQPPKFEDGFTAKAVIGGLFIAFIMLPGALYLGLVAGQSLGGAAQWVTIVLFAEIAKRSFIQLKRQEIYMLFYVTGGLMAVATTGAGGGAFGSLIWSQYFIQSPQAGQIAHMIPHWVVPPANAAALAERTFLDPVWKIPILLLISAEVLSRMNWLGMGYLVFRLTSDIERLPFPMAPVAVAGATALAEAQSKEESWRWQVFSIGTMMGLIFGVVYLAIPIFTGVVLSKPLMLIPIPFIDLTKNTENMLPAALTGISGDLTNVLIGFVLPFEIVAGMFGSSVLAQIVTNPILQKNGLLPTWRPGMGTIEAQLSTNLDFWMSVGIGVQIAVAVIGIYSIVKASISAQRKAKENRMGNTYAIPKDRGDFPILLAFASWFAATIGSILICHSLVPNFPWLILAAFGLLYSPIMSYVSARMFGLTGMGVAIPFIREAAIFKSGYKGFDVWFAPIPINDVGAIAQRFREVELTGTKFTSILKAEAFMLPVMLIASFLWWSFFWHSDPIPSPQFTFAQKFWPVNATMQSMWLTAYRDRENSFLFKVMKPDVMVGAGAGSILLFMVMSVFKIPALYFYGFAAGIGGLPHTTIPTFIGAMAGKFYFAKRFGAEKWRSYAPVILAGFSCGMGLIGMTAIALAMISKSVSYLPY